MIAETQMRAGQAAGLLGVIVEVSLNIFVSMVTDDLDGVFVRANGAVRTQAPEFTGGSALRLGVRRLFSFQRQAGHIVVNREGETLFRAGFSIFINCEDIGGNSIFGTQTIAAGVNRQRAVGGTFQSHNDIQEQRFADGPRLFGSVQNGQGLGRCRNRFDQMILGERTVQADFDQAGFAAVGVDIIDRLFDGVADRSHRDDDMLRIFGAVVVEQFIVGPDFSVDFVHVLLYDCRNRIIVGVAGLASLEENVGILCSAAQNRMVRVQCTVFKRFNSVHIQQFTQVFVVPNLDFLDLMRSTEAVEEMQERHAALNGGQMRHSAQIHNLLRVLRAEHRETGLAAGVYIRVIAVNVECVRGYAASGYVDHAGQQLTGDFIHVGDHQQKALRSGEGRSQCTTLQRAVHGTGSAASDCISTTFTCWPNRFFFPSADHLSVTSAITEEGVMG